MRRMLRRLKQLLADREALFIAREIDSMADYRRMRQQGKLSEQEFGDIFLVVDNFGTMQADLDTSDADIINDISHLISNGLTYGVHVVLATNLWSEIRPRHRANIGSRLELRLNDPADSEIDRKLAATLPADAAGRGLYPAKQIFQAALPVIKGGAVSELSVQQALEDLVSRANTSWDGPIAPSIRVLPLEVLWNELPLPSAGEPAGVPIALEEMQLNPFYLDLSGNDAHLLILGDRECGKTTLLRTWMRGLTQRCTSEQVKILLIDYRKTLAEFLHQKHLLAYAVTPDQVKKAVNQIKAEMEARLAENLKQEGRKQGWNGPHYYLVADDYEGVATPLPQNANPLNPLESFFASGPEIGLHVILARRVTEVGRTNFDPIYRVIRNMESPGLLKRGDSLEGRQVLHKQNISDNLPTGRAIYVTRGASPTMIQIARTDP